MLILVVTRSFFCVLDCRMSFYIHTNSFVCFAKKYSATSVSKLHKNRRQRIVGNRNSCCVLLSKPEQGRDY